MDVYDKMLYLILNHSVTHYKQRKDAEAFLTRLKKNVSHYGYITFIDFLELCDWDNVLPDFCINNGWEDLEDAQIVEDGDCYILKMPKMVNV